MEVKDETPGGAELASRIRTGDQHAEAELVDRYSRGVSFILRRYLNRSSVEDDLYQETFRIALEKIRHGDLRSPERLSGFICAIARNLVIEYFRRASKQVTVSELDQASTISASGKDQLDSLLRDETAALVRQVLRDMPSDRDRQVLFRFYIAEDDKERICADLGLSGLHFNRVIHRARERFRELYRRLIR